MSIPGVTPSANITQIQAIAACRNAGKRLLTNGEWTAAALGTPDPGTDDGTSDCNVDSTSAVANTGSRSLCVSDTGAFDMVGNLAEWVVDWVPGSTGVCPGWGGFSDDLMCLAGASTIGGPGALIRGGVFDFGAFAGVFAVDGVGDPSYSSPGVGLRCAREPKFWGGVGPLGT